MLEGLVGAGSYLTGARRLSPPGLQLGHAGTGVLGCEGAEAGGELQPPGQVHVGAGLLGGSQCCELESKPGRAPRTGPAAAATRSRGEGLPPRSVAPGRHRTRRRMAAMSPSPGPENVVHIPGRRRLSRRAPRTAPGPGGRGLSVAHPGGHFFLLRTSRMSGVMTRGYDACTHGKVGAVSRGPLIWGVMERGRPAHSRGSRAVRSGARRCLPALDLPRR